MSRIIKFKIKEVNPEHHWLMMKIFLTLSLLTFVGAVSMIAYDIVLCGLLIIIAFFTADYAESHLYMYKQLMIRKIQKKINDLDKE